MTAWLSKQKRVLCLTGDFTKSVLRNIIILGLLSGAMLKAQYVDFIQDAFASVPGDTAVENYIMVLVNSERSKAGLNPVVYDRQLRSAARQHAREMYRLQYFSHTSPVKALKDPGDRVYYAGLTDFAVGENIALHSVRGSPRELAEKFMEQWMHSEGHRANILKEDFNCLGVGVITFVDSTVQDTMINNRKIRQVTYAVRNYGVQVFADRDLEFYELSVERRKVPLADMELIFKIDRPVMARIGNRIAQFEPDKFHTTIRFTGLYETPMQVRLAYMDNFQNPVYIHFFSGMFDRNNLSAFEKALSRTRFPLIRKTIRFIYDERPVLILKAKAHLRTPFRFGVVHFDKNRYYEFEPRRDTIDILLPLESSKNDLTIQFGLGEDQHIQLKHRMRINANLLSRLKKGKSFMRLYELFNKIEVNEP